VAFSYDGRMLATGGRGASVLLWELPTRGQRLRFTGHVPAPKIQTQGYFSDYGVSCLAFSPDDRLLATGGGDGFVIVYDVLQSRGCRGSENRQTLLIELTDEEASKAYGAMCALASTP